MRKLFITGADTGVGKTYVAALVARQLREELCRVGVYKPVASGCAPGGAEPEDAALLWEAAGRPLALHAVCPQRFAAPLAPHLAARAEGASVDQRLLVEGARVWEGACDVLIVEGAGGLMSPLTGGDYYNADLAADLAAPMIVVSANRLGTIHATLATVLAAQQRCPASPLSGVVLCDIGADGDESRATNAAEIRQRCDAPLLATVAWEGGFDTRVDWARLAR